MSEKKYTVVEVFDTLQGEGARAGKRSVFMRLAGCNLWSGRPEDRAAGRGACARWCDTSFAKGTPSSVDRLLRAMDVAWPKSEAVIEQTSLLCNVPSRWCVITGGEPFLQLDSVLLEALHDDGWLVAVETNGSVRAKDGVLGLIDHLCVSPKRGSALVVDHADELKVVLPGCAPHEPELGWSHADLIELANAGSWGKKYVQPQDPIDPGKVDVTYLKRNLVLGSYEYDRRVALCVDFVKKNADWCLSLQTHKLIKIP